MGSIGTNLIQCFTLYGVNVDLYDTRANMMWGHSGLVSYKVRNYMRSIGTFLIRGGALYRVNSDLFESRWYIIWSQYRLV
jgi:hypothetical protein